MSLPESIGRYRVLDFLGQGAMGVVYRGRDEALDRDVALKLMSLAHGADPEARGRFQREARAAARLQHPNIVTIYELGDHEGSPFIAMELLEGIDLQRAIEGGLRPDPRRTLPIVLQLLAGLVHAHENGIVHRDVKPSNVFLPSKRPAKIMDFGVARLAGGSTTAGGTRAGVVVGTPNYMSPEQVRGGDLDGRSDLFSAGLILYELVTGEKAYKGDSVVTLLFKIAHEPADLGLIPRGPSWERLRQVLERALDQERDRRYPDARSMSGELVAALADLGGGADWASATSWGVVSSRTTPRPVAAAAEPQPVAVAVAPAAGGAPVVAPKDSARRWLVAAVGLALAASVLAGFALLALRRGSPGPQAAAVTLPVATATPARAPSDPPPTAAPPSATPTPRPAATAAPDAPSHLENADAEPVPADARAEKASALLEQGRYAAALAEARAVLRREPGDEEARTVAEEAEAALVVEAALRKAREALKHGDKDAAIEHLKQGLAVNSNDRRLLELWREATQ
jgi:serine/threonine-protein kinase